MVCYQITVKGRVQGVFYRASTKNKALELDVKGWVCNASDGSVLIEAEGSKDKIMDLFDWCKKGPPQAKVVDVKKKEVVVKNHDGFIIKGRW